MYPSKCPVTPPMSGDPLHLLDALFANDENRPRVNNGLGQSSRMQIGKDGYYHECVVCRDGGKLICCDHCPNTYHIQCLDPPLKSVPKKKWECPTCCHQRCNICKQRGKLLTCDKCNRTFHLKCFDPKWQRRISKNCTECSMYSSMCAALKRAEHEHMKAAVDGLLCLAKKKRSKRNMGPSLREPEIELAARKRKHNNHTRGYKKQKAKDVFAGTSTLNETQRMIGHTFCSSQSNDTGVTGEEPAYMKFAYSPTGQAFKEQHGSWLHARQNDPALRRQPPPFIVTCGFHWWPLFPRRAGSFSWSEDDLNNVWLGYRKDGLSNWKSMHHDTRRTFEG